MVLSTELDEGYDMSLIQQFIGLVNDYHIHGLQTLQPPLTCADSLSVYMGYIDM